MPADAGRRAWQEIASEDPAWTVLSLPQAKRGRWEADRLRDTGVAAVRDLLGLARGDVGDVGTGLAVDVGCGVGRLTDALADRFSRVVGIDVTPAMLDTARGLLAARDNVDLVEADVALRLPAIARDADVVISERVLQHLPAGAVTAHLRGLIRLLRPGGVAVVQVPVHLPLPVRLQLRRRAYVALRRLGVSPGVLYWRLGLHPMTMRAVPVRAVGIAVADLARVAGVHRRIEPAFGVQEAVVVLRRLDPR